MVVDTFYTILGVSGLFPEFDSRYEELAEEKSPVRERKDIPFMFFDDSRGFVFGVVLFNSGSSRWGWEGGDRYREIPLESLSELEASYKEFFCRVFPDFAYLMEKPFKVFTMRESG